MKRADGNWVDGDRFNDREHERRALRTLLEEGSHVLIVAPRRVGKTSLMRQTARELGSGWTCLHVDLQGCKTPADAIVELSLATRPIQSAWSRTQDIFRNALASVDAVEVDALTVKLRDGVGADWQARGTRLLQELARLDGNVVIFMDELPILVNRMLGPGAPPAPEGVAAADALISWLRKMSIEHRGRVRLVVAGSIGLGPVLHRAGLSATLNTLTPLSLDPWSPEVAIGCLSALSSTYQLRIQPEALAQLSALLGACIPHHVQMFFAQLHDDSQRRRDAMVRLEDVDRVYQTRMLTSRTHSELLHLEERLALVLGPNLVPLAVDLLTEAAVMGALGAEAAGRLSADLLPVGDRRHGLINVLEILVHDGYLRQDGDRYIFLSNLIRDWWKGRFAFGYVPAARREVGA